MRLNESDHPFFEMLLYNYKTSANHYHTQLGLPYKGFSIKELVVSRTFDHKNDAQGKIEAGTHQNNT